MSEGHEVRAQPSASPEAPTESAAVVLTDVSLSFGVVEVLERVSLRASPGEFVAVVGPTGSGKSSILNIVAGLLSPTTGQVESVGKPLTGLNAHCAYMFQSDALLPWKTILDNVRLGPGLRGRRKAEATALAQDWLKRVGLDGYEQRYPHQVSGGQRKRVSMAQALIGQPSILLMDEPFSALDVQTRALMEQELLSLWQEGGATVLFVTHDLEEAITMADRIVLLTAGPTATIKGEYAVDLPRPRNVLEARLMPGFNHIYERVWSDLREEVLATYAQN